MYRALKNFTVRGVKFVKGDKFKQIAGADVLKFVRARMIEPIAEAYRVEKHVSDLRIGDVYKAAEIEAWPSFRSLIVNRYIVPVVVAPKVVMTKALPKCKECGREFTTKRGLAAHMAQAH